MFYNYICYWNTFQYKYTIQITFHVVQQSHAWVASKDICLLFIIFLFLFPFCLDFVLFHEALSSSFLVELTSCTVPEKLNKKVKTKRFSNWIHAQKCCVDYHLQNMCIVNHYSHFKRKHNKCLHSASPFRLRLLCWTKY